MYVLCFVIIGLVWISFNLLYWLFLISNFRIFFWLTKSNSTEASQGLGQRINAILGLTLIKKLKLWRLWELFHHKFGLFFRNSRGGGGEGKILFDTSFFNRRYLLPISCCTGREGRVHHASVQVGDDRRHAVGAGQQQNGVVKNIFKKIGKKQKRVIIKWVNQLNKVPYWCKEYEARTLKKISGLLDNAVISLSLFLFSHLVKHIWPQQKETPESMQ